MEEKENKKEEMRAKARKNDKNRNLQLQIIQEEAKYIKLLEEQRILEREEMAEQGTDATVNHIT